MATQTTKSPAMQAFQDAMAKKLFGHETSSCIKADVCFSCGRPAVRFKDELSKCEFAISGLCQDCQDSVFTE